MKALPQTLAVAALCGAAFSGLARPAQAQPAQAQTEATDAGQLVGQWQAANTTCRNPASSAIAAVGACEQRDVFSKLLTLQRYCHSLADKSGTITWGPCGPDAAAQRAAARATEQFHRMGGVFLLPASVNGPFKVYFIVDSGAANVQIPEDIVDQMKRDGGVSDADFLGQRRFILADGSGVQQRIFRVRTLQIGNRTMENVLVALGAPRSRPLLGQSFLRRLEWWKIDNVRNSIEFEFTGAY